MENNIESKVKDLVADFKLDEALDMLIEQAQHQTQRKQNTLLVLKGKLAMLEEQRLACILDSEEVGRQKAAIAHQILDIADGSPLDFELPSPQQQVLVQKTVAAPSSNGMSWGKYLGVGVLLVLALLAGIYISKKSNGGDAERQVEQPRDVEQQYAQEQPVSPAPPQDGPMRVLNFPNLKSPFTFGDIKVEFGWAEAERISDTELRLKIRAYLICGNNLGVCYRINTRIYADGKPIAPEGETNLLGYFEHNSSHTNDLSFILPTDSKEYMIELTRDRSSWKRGFKILP